MKIYIDAENARLFDGFERPYTIFGTPFTAEVVLKDGTGGTAQIEDGTYSLGIDDDYNFADDNLMAYAEATASTSGLTFNDVDTLTQKYESVINGKPSQRVYLQINRIDGTASTTILQDWITARGSVLPIDGTATVLQPLVIRAENAARDAEASAEAAAASAASIPSFPAITQDDNNKVITISGGTFAYSKNLNLDSISINNGTWDDSGVTFYAGTACIYGWGANRTMIMAGGIALTDGEGIQLSKFSGVTTKSTTVKADGINCDGVIKGSTITDGIHTLGEGALPDVSGAVLDIPMDKERDGVGGWYKDVTGWGYNLYISSNGGSVELATYRGCKCFHFNGAILRVAGDLDSPVQSAFNFAGKSFSVCYWIAGDYAAQWAAAVCKRYSGAAADFYMGMNYKYPTFYNGAAASISTQNLQDDAWHHLVFSVDADAGLTSLYIDGRYVTAFNGISNTDDANWLYFGGYNQYNGFEPLWWNGATTEIFYGYMRGVRIYPFALTYGEAARVFLCS